MDNVAINMDVQVFLWQADLEYFEFVIRSSVAGSYGSSGFNFLIKEVYTDFCSDLYNIEHTREKE